MINATQQRLTPGRGLEPTVSEQTILQGGRAANSANPPPMNSDNFLIILVGRIVP